MTQLYRVFLRQGRHTLLLIAAGCMLGQAVFASVELTPHTAEYTVRISVVSGRLTTELEATGSRYIATHVVAPTGLSRLVASGSIAEVSEFLSRRDGLVPIAYRTDDSLSRDKVRADIRFDWETNEASGRVNDEDVLTALEGLSHDRVSIQYELMHDLLNGAPAERYRMYEVDKLRTINVRTIGTRRVEVPAGTFEAVGIQHQAENSSRVTTLWCVEELGYLPVIIEQHRKGKLRVRARLRSYSPLPGE